ncbi:MAG: hypothetical protein ACLGHN_11805 [Bacteriovoracia bacterium]
MKLLLLLLFPVIAFGQAKSESFIIQIRDRSMKVISPARQGKLFSVIVENHSLSDQIGKFIVGNKNLKFVSVDSGKTEVVEFENKSKAAVVFVPVSPAFQEVPLHFGKKAYEIPSTE